MCVRSVPVRARKQLEPWGSYGVIAITDAWSRTARAQAHRANGHALLARTRTSSHTRDAQCAAAVEGDFLSSHVLVLRRLLPRVGSAHGLSLKRALCASACLWPHLAADHPDLLCARTLRPRRLWWSTARIRRGSARRGVSRPLLLPSLSQATLVAALAYTVRPHCALLFAATQLRRSTARIWRPTARVPAAGLPRTWGLPCWSRSRHHATRVSGVLPSRHFVATRITYLATLAMLQVTIHAASWSELATHGHSLGTQQMLLAKLTRW